MVLTVIKDADPFGALVGPSSPLVESAENRLDGASEWRGCSGTGDDLRCEVLSKEGSEL